jgi:hypothetical protein
MARYVMPAAFVVAAFAAAPATAQPIVLISNFGGSSSVVEALLGPDPQTLTYASGLIGPTGMAVDGAKNLYVGVSNSPGNSAIVKVTPSGAVSQFASVTNPIGLAFDGVGNLYVASGGGNLVDKISPTGSVSPFATGFNTPGGLAFDANGNL